MAIILPLLGILGLFTFFCSRSQNDFFSGKPDDNERKNPFEKDKFEREYADKQRHLESVDSKQNSTPIELERQGLSNDASGVRTIPSKHVKPVIVHIDGSPSENSDPSAQTHQLEPDVRPAPEPLPDLRPAPAPLPEVRPAPAPAPVVRPAPEPLPEVRPAPVVRPAPAPVVRPAPAPLPDVRPAPVVRPAPAPAPVIRPAPAPLPDLRPAPVVRTVPTPTVRPTPAPVIRPAPVVRPRPAPAPVGFSPYWDLRRPMDFDVNSYDFDFIPKRNIGTDKVSGYVDGPFTHNGGFYVRESRGKRFVMDLHFGNNSAQDSDMRVHVVVDNGKVNISGMVQGKAIPHGGITVPLRGSGTRSNPYRFTYNDPDGTTHNIRWCPG